MCQAHSQDETALTYLRSHDRHIAVDSIVMTVGWLKIILIVFNLSNCSCYYFFTLHGIDVHVYLRSSQVSYQDSCCIHCLISEEMTIWLSQCPRVNSAQLPAKLLSNWDKNYAGYCIAPFRSAPVHVCGVFWPLVILDRTLIRCNFDVKTVILQSLEAPVAITDDVTWAAQAFTMSLFVYIGSLTLTLCVFVSLLSYLSCRQ